MIHKLSFSASITSLKIVKLCDTTSCAFINHSAGSNLGQEVADLLEHQASRRSNIGGFYQFSLCCCTNFLAVSARA